MLCAGCCQSQGPVTQNVLNTSERTPGHPEANDPHARARLYSAVTEVVFEVADAAGLVTDGDGPVLPGVGVQGA